MKGFYNIGNTCYLNSGLQMLVQNKDLCNLVIKYSKHSDILKTIADFINDYHNNDSKAINPSVIKEIVEKRQHIFEGFFQQDSSEFVIFLLDIIDEEIKKITKNSEVNKIFGLKMNVRIKCKFRECLNIVNKEETNNFLILDMEPEFKTLDDAYRNHRSGVKLETENMYLCEKCKVKRIASKRVEIQDWPNHLIIILKRFKQYGFRFSKMNQPLDVPLEWRHNNKLSGAIIHYGNMNGGHYVYVGKHNDKWYLYDDSSVSEIKTMEELKVLLTNAYCLYYNNI
jgi:ubiquitin C-terminal hydrolase